MQADISARQIHSEVALKGSGVRMAEQKEPALPTAPEPAVAASKRLKMTDTAMRATSGAVVVPLLVVETLDHLRNVVGDFVVKHMNSPQTYYGFGAKPPESVDPSALEKALWKTHRNLDIIYGACGVDAPASLAYRSMIIDVRSELKMFLLDMKSRHLDQGVGVTEKPAFLTSCIELESSLGQTIQKVQAVRLEESISHRGR